MTPTMLRSRVEMTLDKIPESAEIDSAVLTVHVLDGMGQFMAWGSPNDILASIGVTFERLVREFEVEPEYLYGWMAIAAKKLKEKFPD